MRVRAWRLSLSSMVSSWQCMLQFKNNKKCFAQGLSDANSSGSQLSSELEYQDSLSEGTEAQPLESHSRTISCQHKSFWTDLRSVVKTWFQHIPPIDYLYNHQHSQFFYGFGPDSPHLKNVSSSEEGPGRSQQSQFIFDFNYIMSNYIHKPTLMFYRRLLKTMMKTFIGDYNMFHQCRMEARKKIMESAELRDPVEIQEKIFFGEEVNVMQGKLQESGNYRFKARSEHSVGSSVKDGSAQ